MEPIIQIGIAAIIFLPLSLFLLTSGVLGIRIGIGVLYPPHLIAILITRVFKGKKAALKLKSELKEKQKGKEVGYQSIVGGTIMLLMTIVLFIDAIQKL